jgi:hypothetical protein
MAGPTRDVALAIEALLDRKARIKLPDGGYVVLQHFIRRRKDRLY